MVALCACVVSNFNFYSGAEPQFVHDNGWQCGFIVPCSLFHPSKVPTGRDLERTSGCLFNGRHRYNRLYMLLKFVSEMRVFVTASWEIVSKRSRKKTTKLVHLWTFHLSKMLYYFEAHRCAYFSPTLSNVVSSLHNTTADPLLPETPAPFLTREAPPPPLLFG